MSFARISMLAVIVAAAFPAVAGAGTSAAERPVAETPDGIIAILIGAKAAPFTPPIGTNHGS